MRNTSNSLENVEKENVGHTVGIFSPYNTEGNPKISEISSLMKYGLNTIPKTDEKKNTSNKNTESIDTFERCTTKSQPFSKNKRCRILRYGETVDTLFCLGNECPEAHKAMCNDIVSGVKKDDAEAWEKAIYFASSQMEENDNGNNLLRLHRRATSRLLNSQKKTIKSSCHLLSIFLSYASAQCRYSSYDDARQTFKLILNKKISENDSRLYLEYSTFEYNAGDVESSKEILKSGIRKGAKPSNVLIERLNKLLQKSDDAKNDNQDVSMVSHTKAHGGHEAIRSQFHSKVLSTQVKQNYSIEDSMLQGTEKANNENFILTQNSKKRVIILAKRSGVESVRNNDIELLESESLHRLQPNDVIYRNNSKDDKKMLKNNPLNENVPNRSQTLGNGQYQIGEKNVDKDVNKKPNILSLSQKSSHHNIETTRFKGLLINKKHSILSRNRITGSIGSAQRIHPRKASSTCNSDESEVDSVNDEISKDQNKRADMFNKPPPKLTKTDLSYMLNWNPKISHNKESAHITDLAGVPNMKPRDLEFQMDKIVEESPSDWQSSSGGGGAAKDGDDSIENSYSLSSSSGKCKTEKNSLFGSNTPSLNQQNISDDIVWSNDKKDHVKNSQKVLSSLKSNGKNHFSQSNEESTSRSNLEFLPLVSEDNILRVNNIPYVKLGVIGKGGSSKVYRALSKECAVLAIKKVKLDGVDQKAINGYANEIALLKRLSGNPAIIQIHDSEVDLERKSIFLVMELGEVDLNYVLQQQGKRNANITLESSTMSLNMNFIRLTWQQMLNAVHSIHEERIIHGDLKPANFLFVRGALKLIDFGIAKAIQSEDTTNIYRESQIGTLNYMSPEAILDTSSGGDKARMKLGRASDIWSLGCILYQMVYGKTPFADLHMIQKLQAIVNPKFEIKYPKVNDITAVEAIKLCLNRDPLLRPPIVGRQGLLNENRFLNSSHK